MCPFAAYSAWQFQIAIHLRGKILEILLVSLKVIHYKETYQNWNVSYVHACQNVYEVMVQLLWTLI